MISVIIAAYNEERGLTSILPAMPCEVNGHQVRVIVVDDGSTDSTSRVASRHGCTAVIQPENRGKGAALKAGLRSAAADQPDAVVLMDADGQHDPGDLGSIVAPVLDGSADMVVGSRFLGRRGRGSSPWNRYAVRAATVGTLRLLLRRTVTDPYSGYRALSPPMVEALELRGDRYESELEMAFSAARNGMRAFEVPIERRYGPSTSKMGARLGPVLGRVDVLRGYATTIVRETALDLRPSLHAGVVSEEGPKPT